MSEGWKVPLSLRRRREVEAERRHREETEELLLRTTEDIVRKLQTQVAEERQVSPSLSLPNCRTIEFKMFNNIRVISQNLTNVQRSFIRPILNVMLTSIQIHETFWNIMFTIFFHTNYC